MLKRTFLAGALSLAAAPAAAQNMVLRPIEPENALEHAFIAALDNEQMRPAFRRRLLESQVALALASPAADAEPLLVTLQNNRRAAAVFTSRARLVAVLGEEAPLVMLTGREALSRVRAGNVVLNYRLLPMLTLEPADIANYLDIPA